MLILYNSAHSNLKIKENEVYKKHFKLLLPAGIASFFVACGDNGLVELKNNGYNSELYDYGVKQVQE